MLSQADALLTDVLNLAAPPTRESLSAWADQYRVLSSEASAAHHYFAVSRPIGGCDSARMELGPAGCAEVARFPPSRTVFVK
jgi:hypothetical protein